MGLKDFSVLFLFDSKQNLVLAMSSTIIDNAKKHCQIILVSLKNASETLILVQNLVLI